MKYMGSKARIAKEILPIILKDRKPEQWYVEPFAGGMNSICEVDGPRLAADVHPYLIAMWQELVNGWTPSVIDKSFYAEVKASPQAFEPYIVGWIGFNCSYSGKWFGGFAGQTKTKAGTVRDYQAEAIKNVLRQVPKMQGVTFVNNTYDKLLLPLGSVVYCDPPYAGTTAYEGNAQFDHDLFWHWVRNQTANGHQVFVSEYAAPDDFVCVWEKSVKSSLSANGRHGGNKESVERLFVHESAC